jgi:hypothetical protein
MRCLPGPVAAVFTVLLIGAAVAGCAGSPPSGASPGSPTAARLPLAVGDQRLSDVCPPTVVIQDLWEPDANQATEYQLVGPGYTVDSAHKRVIGPLVVDGKDTGVKVEVRSGGAAIGFVTVPAQMYLDHSIMLGSVQADLAIATSADQPVTAVVAPLTKSPQILMWDPASHPNWRTIGDIGSTDASVVVAKDNFFPALLVSKGLINKNQIDTGYTGAPSRFVTDPTIAQQGYATSEPYIYRHEIPSWAKPVRYQLLSDVGYSIYPQMLSVRSADLARLAPCLTKLVPIVQRAAADYLADPARTNALIVDLVRSYNDGWTYSIGVANYAAATLKRLGIMANDTSGPLGGIDPARMRTIVDTFAPILARSGANVRPNLTPADLSTTRFLDPTIKLH